jgi:hypothetical protein
MTLHNKLALSIKDLPQIQLVHRFVIDIRRYSTDISTGIPVCLLLVPNEVLHMTPSASVVTCRRIVVFTYLGTRCHASRLHSLDGIIYQRASEVRIVAES